MSPRSTAILPVAALLSLLACAPVAAQFSVEAILEFGDEVEGVGNVTSIDALSINDAGVWIIQAGTTFPDNEQDVVLLQNGRSPHLREGQSLSQPAGAAIDSFDSVHLNACGDSVWNLGLDNTMGLDDDTGVYFFDRLLIQEGDLSIAPGLSSGTRYLDFFQTKLNDPGDVLLVASVDDPAIDSSFDPVILRIETDGVDVLSESVIAKEGDFLTGQINPVISFATLRKQFDFNNTGDVLFQANVLGGFTDAIYINDTVIAMEGDPSPIAGRDWFSLSDPEMALNDVGDYAFSGLLDGDFATNSVIVSSSGKVVQEGDTLPDIAPHRFFSFGNNPILITNAGDILWWGNWDDPDFTRDTGLFLNDSVIVQEGVTTVEGLVVEEIRTVGASYTTSDDGRYILFEALLEGGFDAAILLTLEGLTTRDPSPGIAGQVNTFSATGATDGAQLVLLAGREVGSTPVPGCQDLKVGLESPIVLGSGIANGGVVVLDRLLPAGLSGQTLHFQAVDRTNCEVGTLNTFVPL